MKNIIVMTLAILLATSYAASAAPGDPEQNTPAATTGQSYTIQEIISKLKAEIAKGTSVYTPNELQRLKSRLDDEQRFYEEMTSNS
ncbi:MAG: hypothetical protein P4L44_04670 [Oryzomonas sp.]|uniref:hypothetical protein n=1 Tax=Oryzomonas sp. TaxID=2855186 RepID=UPI0028478B4B|nr:hypothetical protein [Oryzomonas sp.]MDR3579241.1 hypothetical protein [Oryzomonas sp.]